MKTDENTVARCEGRAQVFKALAHPTRVLLVEMLADKECCVCELTEVAEVDMSTVSKHLSILKNAGIVESRKSGLQVFYRLRTPCVLRFFECVTALGNPARGNR